jgi:diguanylate cyclase (GGDEF)-like protein
MNDASAAAQARILIVDDEPANVHVLAEALAGLYDVRFATDAARALALATAEPVDLILSDVVMPGMDGFELLRRLKADPALQHVPVIFVTAMDEIDDEERGLLLGAVDYITKPIRPAIVRARVRTHIELKTQRDLLEQRALIDGLTGIANRRRFDQELDARWRAAQRSATPLSLVLIDVDHFKQFNDSYGHGAGDDCLRRVAGAIAACCSRSGDLAARYGGEEFALILPGAAAEPQLRRLLQSIRGLGIPHRASSAADVVTASVGVVEVVPQAAATAQQALEQADRQLYAAKQEGRNRCIHLRLADGERRVLFAEESP